MAVTPIVEGALAALHRPAAADRDELLALAVASSPLHGDWVAPPTTRDAFRAYRERIRGAGTEGYLVRDRATGRLAGVVNLNNIARGALQSGSLGYYGFVGGVGRGVMTDGVRLVVAQAFGPLGLHRVEAAIQPGNERSRRLVARLGFRYEGLAPRLVRVAGAWRDHERWAVTIEEWPAAPVEPPASTGT